jgi:hypothetical protein
MSGRVDVGHTCAARVGRSVWCWAATFGSAGPGDRVDRTCPYRTAFISQYLRWADSSVKKWFV